MISFRKKKDKRPAAGVDAQDGTAEPASTQTISTVINISPVELSTPQMKVLTKGLSFAPTNNTNHFETRRDLFRFYRNLHLKLWYSQKQPGDHISQQNFSDKGGAVVVWHYDKYIQEAHRQLQNNIYYTELPSNPLSTMKEQLDSLLTRVRDNGWINTAEYGFLSCEHPRLATFYMLPKVHKEPKDNPPGRPIVAANGTLTEPASQYIDYFLKPYVQSLPSYVKDTTDVLNKLNQVHDIPWDFMVTMDVETLYTNIDHSEGLRAVNHYLSDREGEVPPTGFFTGTN